MAARCFEERKLHALIFDDIKEQMDVNSIDILSEVAYECLQKDQEKRPTMALVIQELEKALDIHVEWEFEQKLPKDNENIMKMIELRESQQIKKKDLYSIFSSGIRLNNGKVLLSLNKDGKAKEMISATMFSYEKCSAGGLWGRPCGSGPIFLDGIEFQPIDNVEHEKSVDRSINADSSINWDQQSSSDFREIMKRSQYDVLTMTKQELDKLLSTGVLFDNGEKVFLFQISTSIHIFPVVNQVLTDLLLYNKQLFSLSKMNCKKCHMLPAKAVINNSLNAEYSKCQPSTSSRFKEVVELQRHRAFSINCNIETKMLSADTAYACYLVFQLPENSEGLKCPVKARDLLNKNNKDTTIIYLKAPDPVDLYRDKRVPEHREDGWMEVIVWEFFYNNEIKDNFIPMELKLIKEYIESSKKLDERKCYTLLLEWDKKHRLKKKKNKIFRYSNYLTDKEEFIPLVQQEWSKIVTRHKMFTPVKNVKGLKQALKRLSQKNGNLFEIASMFKEKLKEVRGKVDKDSELRKKLLINVLKEYNEAVPDEEKLLYQLAKVDWLKEGDKNSACFHELIRGKRHRSYIYNVCDEHGVRYVGDEVLLNLSNTSK
ncbi:phloem protein 2-like protein [Tanacetum coccineum]